MRKLLSYLVLDSETATLPFVNLIANGCAEVKKKIAIARPLIYDIGWTVCNRLGEIIKREQFLVAEIFCVPSVFNTAYYAEKRPIYLEKLQRGEITIKPWNEIIDILIKDMQSVNAVGAFNSMFDFKKAIPFTELYISKLYSKDYYAWEKMQYKLCEKIATEPYKKNPDKEFDNEAFLFRGVEYPLFDLWGLATTHLLNNVSYKTECLEHDLLTNSGLYFKTSAESTYQYLMDKYDFEESHTALDDAIIESYILGKVARKHSISIGIKYFPFRDLGYTTDFVTRTKKPKINEVEKIIEAIETYLSDKDTENEPTAYVIGLLNKIEKLNNYLGRD